MASDVAKSRKAENNENQRNEIFLKYLYSDENVQSVTLTRLKLFKHVACLGCSSLLNMQRRILAQFDQKLHHLPLSTFTDPF